MNNPTTCRLTTFQGLGPDWPDSRDEADTTDGGRGSAASGLPGALASKSAGEKSDLLRAPCHPCSLADLSEGK